MENEKQMWKDTKVKNKISKKLRSRSIHQGLLMNITT